MSNPVYGLVLAGGRSRRLGSDKALLVSDGQSQLARIWGLLEQAVDRAFVSVREDQAGEPERNRFEQVVDRYTDIGPVAGILSAMDEFPEASDQRARRVELARIVRAEAASDSAERG